MSAKAELIREFELFRGNGGGIESWFSESMPDYVADSLLRCDTSPISCEELNQFLILSHEAGVSRGFFKHYFSSNSYEVALGPYDPRKLPFFEDRYLESDRILSLSQLKWGLYRLYVDSLLLCGNIRQGFRLLRNKTSAEIQEVISSLAYDTPALMARGDFLELDQISKDDRYLIAEIACKTYAPRETTGPTLLKHLALIHRSLVAQGRKTITFKDLISANTSEDRFASNQLTFSLDEILDSEIEDDLDLEHRLEVIAEKFSQSRRRALKNTDLYLSMISDLDIYVATSMRYRADFRVMADFCDEIFNNEKIKDLKLRHFDPTLSAAIGHEDKGLIECLMVKCAKVLVYSAGERESYGKDVEAAMALSLGKPVIFFCDSKTRSNFYREIHPLARLINFDTGVAVGAIVTDNPTHVVELLSRIFRNDMQYELAKKADHYFMLKDKLTGSTVRLQTDHLLLRETFWNYYNREAGLLT